MVVGMVHLAGWLSATHRSFALEPSDTCSGRLAACVAGVLPVKRCRMNE